MTQDGCWGFPDRQRCDSGFLLWQSAHSEFYFCDVPWPAFRKVDFLRAVRAYQHRKHRSGK
ncbi:MULTISPECIES: undecaprenyl diphosphate synthase family protein [unclassified Inquilinus]|uniref:undecaprenyl diphosphate synthase family protein n=1 Tax=unclassified Inquilinus TaxID=2645927 RepID=UPI003F8FE1B3